MHVIHRRKLMSVSRSNSPSARKSVSFVPHMTSQEKKIQISTKCKDVFSSGLETLHSNIKTSPIVLEIKLSFVHALKECSEKLEMIKKNKHLILSLTVLDLKTQSWKQACLQLSTKKISRNSTFSLILWFLNLSKSYLKTGAQNRWTLQNCIKFFQEITEDFSL